MEKEPHIVGSASHQVFELDTARMVSLLRSAPHRDDQIAENLGIVIEVPSPEGDMMAFRIVRYDLLDTKLAKRYPHFGFFYGVGIDKRHRSIQLGWTGSGLHATVRTVQGTVLIDPLDRRSKGVYRSAYQKDFPSNGGFECGVEPAAEVVAPSDRAVAGTSGCTLRRYRLAVATTGEYSNLFGATPSTPNREEIVMTQVTIAINKVNEVLRSEVGIELFLIDETTDVFYYAPNDLYTNGSNDETLLNQNQTNLDAVIGTANYDIGHVFAQGGGGRAASPSVCNNSYKAKGYSKQQAMEDPRFIGVLLHEIGHQFGARHTFNGNAGSCAGNSNPASLFELGSGSTIMAYGGLCTQEQNVEEGNDQYFHISSMGAINNTSNGLSGVCGTTIQTSNESPLVTLPIGLFYIPKGTPFRLTASANDPDGDLLHYCWEQRDQGGWSNSPAWSTTGPLFRSRPPSSSATRHFPQLPLFSSGSNFEYLPTVAREMNFSVLVRDRYEGGNGAGCTASASLTVDVQDQGPFKVTGPTVGAVFDAAGQSIAVEWTTNTLNFCNEVNILLSVDGGQSFPFVLAENVPNSVGSYTVDLPPMPQQVAHLARIMVECADNETVVFYNVSSGFSIASCGTAPLDRYISEPDKVYDTNMSINGKVFIQPGAQLTITSEISFSPNSQIIVRRGGKLHVNGGTLTRCESQGFWQGIVVEGNSTLPQPTDPFGMPGSDEAGIVLTTNDAEIKYARHAITANTFDPWWDESNRGGLVYCENTKFIKCHRSAAFYQYRFENKSRFIDCTFDATGLGEALGGVSIWATDGIVFDDCTFKGMQGGNDPYAYGIEAYDAGVRVVNGNKFSTSQRGIVSRATAPFSSSGLYVGPDGGASNTFELNGNGVSIELTSSVSSGAPRTIIEENEFKGNGDGVWLDGLNRAVIKENDFSQNEFSVRSDHTGNGLVDITCNEMLNINSFPIAFFGRNDRAFFSRNFFGTQFNFGNVTLWGEETFTTVGAAQGGPSNPARNCFESGHTEHIWTFGGTGRFFYYHLPGVCEDPQPSTWTGATNNYVKVVTDLPTEPETCPLFFKRPNLPPFKYEDYVGAKGQYGSSLAAAQAAPENGSLQYALLQAEEEKRDIMLWFIEQAIATGQKDTAELILQLVPDAETKRLQYGMRLKLEDWQGAQAALDSLPQGSDLSNPDVQFRVVQEINLARLSHTGSAFELSEQQLDVLLTVADMPSAERGYARALLGLLEGRHYWPEPLELPEPLRSGPAPAELAPQARLGLYPNPSDGRFVLQLPQHSEGEVEARISSAAGQRLRQLRLGPGQQFNLDLSGQAPGLYLIEVLDEGRPIGSLKAIVK